jgi:hypothetical protein
MTNEDTSSGGIYSSALSELFRYYATGEDDYSFETMRRFYEESLKSEESNDENEEEE